MKFSFIIPAFNEEEFISNCVKSIKNQEGDDFEIIVVDNGSSDKTAEIAKNLGVALVSEEKKGISNARNFGVMKAKGEFLCFVDADGTLSNNWLSEAREIINKNNIKAIARLNIFVNNNLLKKFYFNIYTFFAYLALILYEKIFPKLFLPGNNLVIKRSIFLKLGGFEPYIAEDIFLSKKFWKLKNRKSVFNPKMIIFYSSRRFEREGFLKTILFWIRASFCRIPGDNYSIRKSKIF